MRHLFSILVASLVLAGCAGSHGSYHGDFNATVRPDGTVEVERHARSEAQTTDPRNAKEGGGFNLGDNGATANAGAAWEEKAVDWVGKNTWVIYVIGGVAFVGGIAGALYFGVGYRMLCVGVAAGGGLLLLAPMFLQTVGVPLSIAIVVGIVALGAVWCVSHFKTVKDVIADPSSVTDKIIGVIKPSAGATQ